MKQWIRGFILVVGTGSAMLGAVACMLPGPVGPGEGEGEGDGEEQQGFTDCSGVTCQPGQYCWAPGVCENGCLSDVNCAADQDCAEEGSGFDGAGVCRDDDGGEGEGEGEGEPPGNALEDCLAACDFFQTCGLGAQDAVGCRNDCPDLSENQQIAVGNCDDSSCGDALVCLGIECFADADCDGDEQCVGSACM